MPELEHTVLLAVNAHMGQKDKAGESHTSSIRCE